VSVPSSGADRWSEFRSRQRKWLSGLGIVDRPWLILGAAPSPTMPEGIFSTHARVDINNAGLTARSLGLGPADLTIRKKSKSWAEYPDLNTRGLLWYNTSPTWLLRLQLLTRPRVRVGSIMTFKRSDRDGIVEMLAGESLQGAGDIGKATNGVAGLCYALFVGVPQIVLCGISLSKQGHSYNELARKRLQVSEDAFVLSKLKDRPEVFTTEPGLAAEAGIKLWPSG
jgi:hypothetical protein